MTEFLSLRASPRAAGPDKEEGITNRPAASTGRAGSPPLRVASLGADSLCRYCIESMLRDIGGGVEAMHATDAQQIAQRVSDGDHIDLVLIVAMCPGGLTLSQFDAVRVALPGIPIAVHSSRDDPAHAASLIRRGAGGVITTTVTREVAVAALRLVAAGGVYAAHAAFMERDPAGPTASASAAGAGPHLTQRETAILALIGRALSNKEILQRLGLAEATVKIHVRNLLRKTRLRKRIELALLVAQSGH